MQKVYVRMPKRGVYAVFDCGDDTDLEYTLQYKIMPYEPNVIYTMNRH